MSCEFDASDSDASMSQMAAPAGHEPPRFVVDLSVAPEHRYDHVARALSHVLDDGLLATEFDKLTDELVSGLGLPARLRGGLKGFIRLAARLALRRVYTDEETAELRGMARETSLPMYLLVALNVLLDLMMGCTSGGVRVDDGGRSHARLLHLRTLDWEMEPLRQLVVELDFVPRAGAPVVATTVGYFGYVGVLTGVRAGLAMSLNFRPTHDACTVRRRVSFRAQQLLALVGLRPTLSSRLRHHLLQASEPVTGLLADLGRVHSSAAYLVFTTPQRVYSLEKDNGCAALRDSDTFLVTCNHDVAQEAVPDTVPDAMQAAARPRAAPAVDSAMGDIVDESFERKTQATAEWERLLRDRPDGATGIATDDVPIILRNEWVVNVYTHYAVVMDPEAGTVLWRRAYAAGEIGGRPYHGPGRLPAK